MKRHLYTPAELKFLERGYKRLRVPELTAAFNKRFRRRKSACAIRSTLRNYGFLSGRPTGSTPNPANHIYSVKIQRVIRKRYLKLSVVDLAQELKKKHGVATTAQQLKTYVQNHGISSGRTGQFSKGIRPWNTGTKGICKPNSGCFKKGQKPVTIKPVGSERICPKDGFILVKTRRKNPHTGYNGWYRHKHVVVWEKHNGKVPAGHVITFRDCNKLNCEIQNLECITRSLHVRLNQLKYWEAPPELRPTIRLRAQLALKIGEKKQRLAA